MTENHERIPINQFLGIYSRGDTDNIPPNHFIDALNIAVDGEDIKTREGSVLAFTKANVLRVHPYRKYGEATRFLILTSAGSIFDTIDLNTAILTIAGMTDFSVATLFNRIYITPHNRNVGMAGEKVYVYTGTGLARPAAGAVPTGFTLGVADSAMSGYVEAGTRLFAIAYLTSSGFITAPGPTIFTTHVAAGGKKIDITNAQNGPTGTVGKYVICTKMIDSYDGNQSGQTFYFAYGGYIADNTTTSITLDFFDAQLVDSADYLFDQLSEIPASVGLLSYGDSLVSWGENSYPYLLRVSKQGEPESFNGEIGFMQVNPGDSSSIKNVVEFRSQLVICKSGNSCATSRVAGQEAAFWPTPTSIDPSIGAEAFGIGSIYGAASSFQDYFVTANRSGLYLFTGTYAGVPLSDKIKTLWKTISEQYFDTIQVVLDTDKKRVYLAAPVGASSPNQLWMMDYSNGMSAESVVWYRWTFPIATKTITLDRNFTTNAIEFYFGSTNVYKLSDTATDDFGTAIDSYIKTAKLSFDDSGRMFTYSGIRARLFGSGSLTVTISSLDDANSETLGSITLSATPGKPVFRPLNYVADKASLTLRVSNFGEWFRIRSFILFGLLTWNERPQ